MKMSQLRRVIIKTPKILDLKNNFQNQKYRASIQIFQVKEESQKIRC